MLSSTAHHRFVNERWRHIRRHQQKGKYITAQCANYSFAPGLCRYGSRCTFAHGEQELRHFRALYGQANHKGKSGREDGSKLGSVLWYNVDLGYGRIACVGLEDGVYVCFSDIECVDGVFPRLESGDAVEFQLMKSDCANGHPKAVNVTALSGAKLNGHNGARLESQTVESDASGECKDGGDYEENEAAPHSARLENGAVNEPTAPARKVLRDITDELNLPLDQRISGSMIWRCRDDGGFQRLESRDVVESESTQSEESGEKKEAAPQSERQSNDGVNDPTAPADKVLQGIADELGLSLDKGVSGCVLRYNADRGYGRIAYAGLEDGAFVRSSDIQCEDGGSPRLESGDAVEFNIMKRKNGNYKAVEVRVMALDGAKLNTARPASETTYTDETDASSSEEVWMTMPPLIL